MRVCLPAFCMHSILLKWRYGIGLPSLPSSCLVVESRYHDDAAVIIVIGGLHKAVIIGSDPGGDVANSLAVVTILGDFISRKTTHSLSGPALYLLAAFELHLLPMSFIGSRDESEKITFPSLRRSVTAVKAPTYDSFRLTSTHSFLPIRWLQAECTCAVSCKTSFPDALIHNPAD